VSVLSVDLGTSNTVAVLSAHGRPPRVVDVDGSSMMPSAVFAAEDGTLVVGREAERRARLAPARYEPNPKRRVDEGTLLLGDTVVQVTAALAAVLGKVAAETTRQLSGARPDEVRLTHPAQWGPARRNILLTAARQAGLGTGLQLVPEPVAAAAHFASFTGRTVGPGQALAVYDLGAGTFDVAVVGASDTGFTVLAENGLPDLGGLDVDQAILEHLGRTVSTRDPAQWQRLLLPQSTADRRAARSLREDVRAAKESLSEHPQTEVPLPDPFGDALLTRAELESLIRPGLLRSVEVLASTIQAAGMSPAALAGIYLVGGSSRIPLVATLISEQLRVLPVNLDQPETAVALGAHHVNEAGINLRTTALPDDIPAHLAESRTVSVTPPRPSIAPTQQHVRSMPQAVAPMPRVQPFAVPAPAAAPLSGPPGPHPGYTQPVAPRPPRTAAQQLGIIGCVALFVLGVLSASSIFTAVLSVPLAYAGLRLAGKEPMPLSFFCYGYAGVLAAHMILGIVVVIAEPASTDSSDLIPGWIFGGVALVLALTPLVARATRERKSPPTVR
jgi:Hsp70 protein